MADLDSTVSLALKDIYSFVICEGHGVKGLADTGINSLPDQYIIPEEERHNHDKVVNNDKQHSIPIIDMSNLDDPKMEKLICDAAEKLGFFQIINHGVPPEVLDEVKAATHRFFESSPEEKRKYLKKNSPTNHVRYGTSFVPEIELTLEWKDYLSFYFASEDDALLWPISCRNEALQYIKGSQMVARNLLKILMKGLNINVINNSRELDLMGTKRINFNYYPKCPNPELTVGVGRHSDVSTLTILLQDDVGGLYVRDNFDGDSWIHVPPINGALVINVGDALQILSNGRYISAEHRVIPSGCKNRVSIPVFVNPMPNSVMAPLSELINGGSKPIYKEVIYAEYVKNFYRNAHNGKATIDFAKI